MRYVRGGALAGSLAALVSLLLTGCGGVIDREDEPLPPKRGKGGAIAAQTGTTLDPVKGDYKGVIRGKVIWDGEEPPLEAGTTELRAKMKANNDGPYCMSGSELEKQQQAYRIGDNKGLGNVFVWIVPPSGQALIVDDENAKQIPPEVMVSQPHCIFLPHCVGVTAARYNKDGKKDTAPPQVLVVQNDASTTHNANVEGGALNSGFPNRALGAWDKVGRTSRAEFALKPEEDAVKIRCGVHGWMLAYARAFDHPYHAVSSVGANFKDAKKPVWEDPKSPEFGTFEIKGVPIGATVTVRAWHEELGELPVKPSKTITLKPDNEVVISAKKK